MAKFTVCLLLCLLLAAFVGAFGSELSDSHKTTLVNEIAEKMLQRKILDGVEATLVTDVAEKMFLRKMKAEAKTSETADQVFLKQLQLKGLPVCGETCVGGTCNTPGCTCSWPVCTRNGLPSLAA
uniref:Kalata-B1 n=2 Tax=Oldenlandia affinis TaxID=60225 RepID=KAB1_OLDAF|nr:RecName: Full=Kalata-B1; Flags: Precursor [Oldenlandia affinis]AAL05477.1 kalata B1 precursor [Oldenlandia affinis]